MTLEVKGYLVYNNLIYTPARNELDILAYNPKDGSFLVGEVKSSRLGKREMKEVPPKLLSPELKKFLLESYGITSFDRYIFSWNEYGEEIMKKDALRGMKIKLVTFPEIVGYLLGDINKVVDKWPYNVNRPNSALLVIISDSLRYHSEYLRSIHEEWNKE